MKVIEHGRRFVVIDDFLSGQDFSAAQTLMKRTTFTQRENAISNDDGPVYCTRGVTFREDLGTTDIGGRPQVYEELARTVHTYSDFYGEAGAAWDRIALAFWKYPAGSGLSWHNDADQGRQGDFILYLHDQWRPSWGGELKLIDEDPQPTPSDEEEESDLVLRMESRISRSPTSPVAIIPKPNRLVLVKSDTVHAIGRVDHTAGDALRCTLTGFVSKSPERERTRVSAREKFATILGAD